MSSPRVVLRLSLPAQYRSLCLLHVLSFGCHYQHSIAPYVFSTCCPSVVTTSTVSLPMSSPRVVLRLSLPAQYRSLCLLHVMSFGCHYQPSIAPYVFSTCCPSVVTTSTVSLPMSSPRVVLRLSLPAQYRSLCLLHVLSFGCHYQHSIAPYVFSTCCPSVVTTSTVSLPMSSPRVVIRLSLPAQYRSLCLLHVLSFCCHYQHSIAPYVFSTCCPSVVTTSTVSLPMSSPRVVLRLSLPAQYRSLCLLHVLSFGCHYQHSIAPYVCSTCCPSVVTTSTVSLPMSSPRDVLLLSLPAQYRSLCLLHVLSFGCHYQHSIAPYVCSTCCPSVVTTSTASLPMSSPRVVLRLSLPPQYRSLCLLHVLSFGCHYQRSIAPYVFSTCCPSVVTTSTVSLPMSSPRIVLRLSLPAQYRSLCLLQVLSFCCHYQHSIAPYVFSTCCPSVVTTNTVSLPMSAPRVVLRLSLPPQYRSLCLLHVLSFGCHYQHTVSLPMPSPRVFLLLSLPAQYRSLCLLHVLSFGCHYQHSIAPYVCSTCCPSVVTTTTVSLPMSSPRVVLRLSLPAHCIAPYAFSTCFPSVITTSSVSLPMSSPRVVLRLSLPAQYRSLCLLHVLSFGCHYQHTVSLPMSSPRVVLLLPAQYRSLCLLHVMSFGCHYQHSIAPYVCSTCCPSVVTTSAVSLPMSAPSVVLRLSLPAQYRSLCLLHVLSFGCHYQHSIAPYVFSTCCPSVVTTSTVSLPMSAPSVVLRLSLPAQYRSLCLLHVLSFGCHYQHSIAPYVFSTCCPSVVTTSTVSLPMSSPRVVLRLSLPAQYRSLCLLHVLSFGCHYQHSIAPYVCSTCCPSVVTTSTVSLPMSSPRVILRLSLPAQYRSLCLLHVLSFGCHYQHSTAPYVFSTCCSSVVTTSTVPLPMSSPRVVLRLSLPAQYRSLCLLHVLFFGCHYQHSTAPYVFSTCCPSVVTTSTVPLPMSAPSVVLLLSLPAQYRSLCLLHVLSFGCHYQHSIAPYVFSTCCPSVVTTTTVSLPMSSPRVVLRLSLPAQYRSLCLLHVLSFG